MSYSKTLSELRTAQNNILSKYNLTLEKGIMPMGVAEEDGLPWLEIYGNIPNNKIKVIIQEIANTMDIELLHNHTQKYKNITTLILVMDFAHENTGENAILQRLSDDPDAKEFMEGYGDRIFPQL